jgi:hypothetical protein
VKTSNTSQATQRSVAPNGCCKCGWGDLNCVYKTAADNDYDRNQRTAHRIPIGEHLRLKCKRCGYAWTEACLDAATCQPPHGDSESGDVAWEGVGVDMATGDATSVLTVIGRDIKCAKCDTGFVAGDDVWYNGATDQFFHAACRELEHSAEMVSGIYMAGESRADGHVAQHQWDGKGVCRKCGHHATWGTGCGQAFDGPPAPEAAAPRSGPVECHHPTCTAPHSDGQCHFRMADGAACPHARAQSGADPAYGG